MTSRYFHLSKKIENIEKDGGGGERERAVHHLNVNKNQLTRVSTDVNDILQVTTLINTKKMI